VDGVADGLGEAYRLVSIKPARRAPNGGAGDWLVYSIAQGTNLITGYRQGGLAAVTAEVERIVAALNERHFKGRARPHAAPATGGTAT
jgi:hypothetical protein